MKQLFVITILLISIICSAKTYEEQMEYENAIAEELTIKISYLICDYIDTNKKQGIELDGHIWTSVDWLYKNSIASYPVDLTAGVEYVAVTLTDGPYVETSIVGINPSVNKIYLPGQSNLLINHFYVSKTGEYKFVVESVGNQKGIQRSYIMYVVKK